MNVASLRRKDREIISLGLLSHILREIKALLTIMDMRLKYHRKAILNFKKYLSDEISLKMTKIKVMMLLLDPLNKSHLLTAKRLLFSKGKAENGLTTPSSHTIKSLTIKKLLNYEFRKDSRSMGDYTPVVLVLARRSSARYATKAKTTETDWKQVSSDLLKEEAA